MSDVPLARVVLLVLASLPAFGRAGESLQIDEHSIFDLSGSLELLTPKPRFVSAALAELCVAPAPADLAAKEKERAGPHANVAVNYYVSPRGVDAMSTTELAFPAGTVILKEKLSPHGQVAAVGGMVKRAEGFDPDNGNWEYFYASRDGGFEIGRIPNCVGCHARARGSDHVYGRGHPVE